MRCLALVTSGGIEQQTNQVAALVIDGRVLFRAITSIVDDACEKTVNPWSWCDARGAVRAIGGNGAKGIHIRTFGVRMSEFLAGFVRNLDYEQIEGIEVGMAGNGEVNARLYERERAFPGVNELLCLVFFGAYAGKRRRLFGCLDMRSRFDDFACIADVRAQFVVAPGGDLGKAVVVIVDGVAQGDQAMFGMQFEHARLIAAWMKLGFAFSAMSKSCGHIGETHQLVFVVVVEVEAADEVFGESAQKSEVGFAVLDDEFAGWVGATEVDDQVVPFGDSDAIEFGLEEIWDGLVEVDFLHEPELEAFGAGRDAESIDALFGDVGEVIVDFGDDAMNALGVGRIGGIEDDGDGFAEDFRDVQTSSVETNDEQVEAIEARDGGCGSELLDAKIVAIERGRMEGDVEDGPSV